MRTESQLNADILKITLMIREKYPELSKYISEMPVTIPNVHSPEINAKILGDYYDSLNAIMKNYAQNSANNLTQILSK
jgi:hypothetical protein